MNHSLMMLTVFAAVSLGILGIAGLAWDVFFRRRTHIEARMKAEFRDKLRAQVKQSGLFRDFSQVAAELKAAQPTWSMRLHTFLAQSGLRVSAQQLWLVALACGITAAIVAWVAIGHWLAAPPAVIAGVTVAWGYVHFARKNRMGRLCQQLPEAFEVMSRALRSGQAVPTAFQVVANDFSSPISEEFAYCFEQQHLGVPFDVALRDLARRTGFVEMQLFATALIINQRVGGNLAEVLNRLAETMRKRGKFHGRLRALTGEGRMQATVLIALPFLAMGALLVLNRSYVQVLFDRPQLLALTTASQIVGTICIRRITNLSL